MPHKPSARLSPEQKYQSEPIYLDREEKEIASAAAQQLGAIVNPDAIADLKTVGNSEGEFVEIHLEEGMVRLDKFQFRDRAIAITSGTNS